MAGVGRKSPVGLRPHVLSASVNASTLICTPVYCGWRLPLPARPLP